MLTINTSNFIGLLVDCLYGPVAIDFSGMDSEYTKNFLEAVLKHPYVKTKDGLGPMALLLLADAHRSGRLSFVNVSKVQEPIVCVILRTLESMNKKIEKLEKEK